MQAWQKYFTVMNEVVQKAYDTQGENLMAAAGLLAECTKQGGLIHVFGCGHSSLVTEDVFWRSATLANVHAIFESAVAGINEITKTSKLEKVEGLGRILAEYNGIVPPDVLLCFSNSGNNAGTIDMAMAVKEKGVKVIAFTNVEYADQLTTQHSSGKKLKDLADIVIDNCSVIGDAAVELEGLEVKVGATSTIPVVYLLAALLVQTCDELLKQGVTPDVYYNGHLAYESDRVKQHNDALVEKYRQRMRNL